MFATAGFVKPSLLMIVVLGAAPAMCFGGCARSQQAADSSSAVQSPQVSPTPYSTLERVGKYAIRCSGYVVPGAPHPTDQPPLSYSADDLGNPGVPDLTTAETATLKSIQRSVRPRHLRFVFLTGAPPSRSRSGPAPTDFVVFDAVAGPCADFAPGYVVLNKRRLDLPEARRAIYDVYYEPGENPYTIHGMTW